MLDGEPFSNPSFPNDMMMGGFSVSFSWLSVARRDEPNDKDVTDENSSTNTNDNATRCSAFLLYGMPALTMVKCNSLLKFLQSL